MLDRIDFLQCIDSSNTNIIPGILKIHENKSYQKILTKFLDSADVDIADIKISILNDDQMRFLNKMENLRSLETHEGKNNELNKLINDNISIIPDLLNKNLIQFD